MKCPRPASPSLPFSLPHLPKLLPHLTLLQPCLGASSPLLASPDFSSSRWRHSSSLPRYPQLPPLRRPSVAASSVASLTASFQTASSSHPTGSGTSSFSSASTSGPPDVLLNVPSLSVDRIELGVYNLTANINLNADIASLVSINAGVAVSVQKVNITITNVDSQLELIVRLGNLVNIVNRVFSSLDLNPLLISALSDVTGLVGTVVGAVDGLLGSITQGGRTLSFIIDNLGNIKFWQINREISRVIVLNNINCQVI